jgi:hypothetical protein
MSNEAPAQTMQQSPEKSQTPMFKREKKSKVQISRDTSNLRFRLWDLFGIWHFEIWDFAQFRNLTCLLRV